MLSLQVWLGLLAGWGSAWAGCAHFATRPVEYFLTPPERTTLSSDRVALPLSKDDELLIVEARINGAGPFRLLVDPGAATLKSV